MENNKIIPIFLACDDNYVKFAMVTLKSIACNANKDYTYKCYYKRIYSQRTIFKQKSECDKQYGKYEETYTYRIIHYAV